MAKLSVTHFAAIAAAVLAGSGLARAQSAAKPATHPSPTFSRDIAPIFQRACQNCRRPEEPNEAPSAEMVGPVVERLEGKAATTVKFTEPGTYRLRAYAGDGVLTTPIDVNVIVQAANQ